LQFPIDASMAITDKAFNNLTERVNDIGERVARIEGSSSGHVKQLKS